MPRPQPLRTAVLVGLAVAILLGSVILDALRVGSGGELGSISAALGAIVASCGAAVLRRQPAHRVGIALVAFGYLWSVDGLLEAWSKLGASLPEPLPGTGFSFWFVDRVGAYLLVGLPLLLIWYPDGRLPAGIWRRIGLATLAMALVLPTALLVMPISVIHLHGGALPPVPEPPFPTLPVSDQTGYWILVVARLLTYLALVPALALIFVRHRRAAGRERSQLRWLLWAAIMCVILVAVSLLVPTSAITYLALYAAVIITSASIAIGITRPDLLDIDSLVAGTVVYAGVAAAVVIVDLAALAALDRLLGDQLDRREITLLVLLVAVAGYGPLRSWLSGIVRRALVGRRGDRYQVVSTLAARLEASGRIDDQLAELTSAVAAAFKMRYVGVRIDTADGVTRSAAYGKRPGVVAEVPLAYAGESVGQLTLPARGIGAMLSRRDRALLVDLVRQSAVAIRSATLTSQLQASREQLVHDREEDRRRIRRDLHDGLGPALGGVALRLDAAGNALDADPERSRQLIRQARTEISDALADVRRLVHGLRPPALDDLGLAAALEQQAERTRTADFAVDVAIGALPRLNAAVEVAAYRIVSEALTNVVRHAQAHRCTIDLTAQDQTMIISVTDDGIGIAGDVTAGVGLQSIRERCAELGGRSTVTCPAAGGTVVTAWIPLLEGEVDD